VEERAPACGWLADVLQTELITPKAEEGAALGAQFWQWWGLVRTQI